MSMTYKVNITTTEPEYNPTVNFWLNPDTGSMYIWLNKWIAIAGSNPVSSYTVGIAEITAEIGTVEPASPQVGLLWLDTSARKFYCYIDRWIEVISV